MAAEARTDVPGATESVHRDAILMGEAALGSDHFHDVWLLAFIGTSRPAAGAEKAHMRPYHDKDIAAGPDDSDRRCQE